MTKLLLPLIVLAGVLQAMGNSMNAQLNASLRNPWLASVVSFLLIVAFFVCAFAVMPRPLPTAESPAGAVAVFMGLIFVSKIGADAFNGTLMIVGISLISRF